MLHSEDCEEVLTWIAIIIQNVTNSGIKPILKFGKIEIWMMIDQKKILDGLRFHSILSARLASNKIAGHLLLTVLGNAGLSRSIILVNNVEMLPFTFESYFYFYSQNPVRYKWRSMAFWKIIYLVQSVHFSLKLVDLKNLYVCVWYFLELYRENHLYLPKS